MANHITRTPSYLSQHKYGFCIRIRVPVDLVTVVCKKELRYSLRTGYLSTAKKRARLVSSRIITVFELVRKGMKISMNLSADQIAQMIKAYVKKTLDEINAPVAPDAIDRGLLPYVNEETLNSYIDELDFISADYKRDLALGDYKAVQNNVTQLLLDSGIEKIDKQSSAFLKLCQGIMQSDIKLIEIKKQTLLGSLASETTTSNAVDSFSQTRLVDPIPNQPSIKLSQLIAEYTKENLQAGNWDERTIPEYKSIFKNLLRIVGDVPVNKIDMHTARRFKQILVALPCNLFQGY